MKIIKFKSILKAIKLAFIFIVFFCSIPLSAEEALEQPADVTETLETKEASINTTIPTEIAVENAPAQEKPQDESTIINADKIEYGTDSKDVTATGNVVVIYKGIKLTCQKLTVNTLTKDGVAQGNARLDFDKGVLEGERLSYNFEDKHGVFKDAWFRSSPYFGKARDIEKLGDVGFVSRYGYFTTCSLDRPHYRIKSKQIKIIPGDKIQAKENTFYVGVLPFLCIPKYEHSLKDHLMHVQLSPGSSKLWGAYMLSAWKMDLAENISARAYLDYRSKLGVSEGFGTSYQSLGYGKGDFKFYYTQERDGSKDLPKQSEGDLIPRIFQRYLIRLRHKWDIDERTNLTTEFYRIVDSKMILHPDNKFNFLKEYFYREYEKEAQPLTYLTIHHAFNYSSLDFNVQPKTNSWYSQMEKYPEIKFSLPSYQLGTLMLYFDNSSQFGNYNYKYDKHQVPPLPSHDLGYVKFDTINKLSAPLKVAFIYFTPFVKSEQTYYDRNIYGSSTVLRTVFYSGADVSTKFFRLFKINTNLLGLNINNLRHVITPSIAYSYNNAPTVLSSKIKQLESSDTISASNSAILQLSNKLQTKRNGQSLDLVDLLVTSNYTFKSRGQPGALGDILLKLKVLPYSWLTINSDATYLHSGDRTDPNYNKFSNANFDFAFNFGTDRSLGFGQRYQRKGGNEMIYMFKWRFNPKWKVSFYQRLEYGNKTLVKTGLREQEYTISRDFHCWEADLAYNTKKGDGDSIWLIFRLKAFPELEFNYNQNYNKPKPGSQSNP